MKHTKWSILSLIMGSMIFAVQTELNARSCSYCITIYEATESISVFGDSSFQAPKLLDLKKNTNVINAESLNGRIQMRNPESEWMSVRHRSIVGYVHRSQMVKRNILSFIADKYEPTVEIVSNQQYYGVFAENNKPSEVSESFIVKPLNISDFVEMTENSSFATISSQNEDNLPPLFFITGIQSENKIINGVSSDKIISPGDGFRFHHTYGETVYATGCITTEKTKLADLLQVTDYQIRISRENKEAASSDYLIHTIKDTISWPMGFADSREVGLLVKWAGDIDGDRLIDFILIDKREMGHYQMTVMLFLTSVFGYQDFYYPTMAYTEEWD